MSDCWGADLEEDNQPENESRRQDGHVRNTSGAARIGSGNGHYSVAKCHRNLFRRAVKLAELQIHFEHVDKLFSSQSGKRRSRILLQDLIDLIVNRRLIALGVVRPLGSDAIQLKLGVRQCDVRVETGTGRRHEIARDILKIGIRMILAPHIEKVRLDIRAIFDRLNRGLRLTRQLRFE